MNHQEGIKIECEYEMKIIQIECDPNRRNVQVLSPCVTYEFASTRTCQNKETTDQKSGTAKVQMQHKPNMDEWRKYGRAV